MLIYFQTAFLSGGDDKFASPYMAFQKPLLVTILKPCNPKSIKPNDYKQSNIINYNMKDANKKESPRDSLVVHEGLDKLRSNMGSYKL
jgi:hypothetical protein